jgi:type III restriction enzyme
MSSQRQRLELTWIGKENRPKLEHQWEKARDYEVVVSKGFTELKESAFTKNADEPIYDFRQTVEDKSRIAQMLFGGFKRCLYRTQKFQSDTERKLALILDRESQKWFKPASGQFQIFYKGGADQSEYIPDFVAETDDRIYLLESKAAGQMADRVVQAKERLCRQMVPARHRALDQTQRKTMELSFDSTRRNR